MKPNIKLHIEELFLDGFPYCNRYRIAEALQLELARLFIEQDMPSTLFQDRKLAQIDSHKFEIDYGAKPEVIGFNTARAIHEVLIK